MLKTIQTIVELHFELPEDALKIPTRRREIAVPRQMYLCFAEQYTKYSYTTIGATVGRDHATVNHAKKTIPILCFQDKQLNRSYQTINDTIKERIKTMPQQIPEIMDTVALLEAIRSHKLPDVVQLELINVVRVGNEYVKLLGELLNKLQA